MSITLNGTEGITLDNGSADGAQVTLASSGYSNWNLDNYSGRFRAYYNATEYFTITNTGNVGIGTSSPSYKLSAWTTGTGTTAGSNTIGQFYSNGSGYDANIRFGDNNNSATMLGYLSGNMYMYTGGAERMRIDSSGNVLIGDTASVGSRVYAKGATSVDGAYTYFGYNSSGTLLFFVRNDGVVSTGAAANSPYNLTTASAANMYVASSGTLFRSTSSIKYKTDVKDAVHGLSDVMKLRPVTYKGKTDGDTVFGGLIAEEVHEAGLTEFVQYAEDGSPDALAYGQMVSLAFKAIQEQQELIKSLTSRIETLEAK